MKMIEVFELIWPYLRNFVIVIGIVGVPGLAYWIFDALRQRKRVTREQLDAFQASPADTFGHGPGGV